MLRLELNQTRGQIGIQTNPSSLEIQNPNNGLDMSVTQSSIKITGTMPRITIDQSACFAEEGQMTNQELIDTQASYANSQWLQSMGRRAEQGNQLANILDNPDAIANQAYENAFAQFQHEFGLGTIPKSRPKIDVIEGTLNIQVQEGTFTNRTTPQKPSMQYTKGSVDIYVKQKPSLDIRFVDTQV